MTAIYASEQVTEQPTACIAPVQSRYREIFGDTWYEERIGALVLRSGRLCAVMTPAGLGTSVLGMLGDLQVPVMAVGVGNRCVWSFLAENPSCGEGAGWWSLDLFRCFVTQTRPGALIALPTPGNPRRTWVREPQDTVPDLRLVAETIVAA
ncbi:hypothetical protein [Nocardia cerradoensis]|uniref:Uncharacterized protein n=1 Tax=Nocardia cerradoensis TaxID=85688 RepID=A0A231H7U5_9NOCA|nr:hypothetical protein [Nocardia cerradoensis]NKY44519.1 hypothetical protein [Nocardia cerradoensis]OXR44929.1 hypothetical protein B7C42_02885 [Nocardia cerradoensis]